MRTLAVFARRPEPGRVKTRLSPALPPDLACNLYRAMLDDTLAAARHASAERRAIVWADLPEGGATAFEGFDPLAQVAGDLGDRLAAALASLRHGPNDRVVIVGSDAPEIRPAVLDAAFAALESCAVVLGPARDGGFYLVGSSRPVAGLFEGVAWSTAHALGDVASRAEGLGLPTELLPPIADVDTPADLVGLIGRLLRAPEAAPRTATALARFGLLPPA